MKIFFAETGHMQHESEPLDYSAFSGIGTLVLSDIRNFKDLALQHADAEVLIIGRLALSREILETFSNLRLIVKAGTRWIKST